MPWGGRGERVEWLTQSSKMKIIDSIQRFIFPLKSEKAQVQALRCGSPPNRDKFNVSETWIRTQL